MSQSYVRSWMCLPLFVELFRKCCDCAAQPVADGSSRHSAERSRSQHGRIVGFFRKLVEVTKHYGLALILWESVHRYHKVLPEHLIHLVRRRAKCLRDFCEELVVS